MSFTFQQQATPASITTTTSGTATFANAPQEGELIVAVLAINSSTATITPPAGFSVKNEYKDTSRSLGIYFKKAASGESTGYTFNFSASVSGTVVMRRYSSTVGWDTDQSGGATDKVWDSTGTVSQVSLNLTTTLNRLIVGIGYASNTSASNKQLNPNSGWSDNTLQYSSRARSAHRTAAGGSEALGYQLTDSTLDNRLAFMVAEFVEYVLKNAIAGSKTLALSWNNRRYSDPSKVPAIDTTPNAFSFTDQTGVALSSTITSAAITVSGINSAATITSSGGTFDINSSGTFISSGTVNNGDTVRARVTSSSSNSTAANCVVTIGGVSDTFTVTTVASGGWQLASGHFIPAKIPLEIIAPRGGLTTANRYYKAYPGIAYRVPVSVLGGSWPFKYELTTAPSGMTIGSVYGDADYGVINWANPTTTASPYTVAVKVTDQEGNIATVSYTITVTTSGFLFVDAVNGNDANAGTIASPKKTVNGWYIAYTDTTYQNYFIYYRTGTYPIADANDPVGKTQNDGVNDFPYTRCYSGRKPFVHLAYPGETATFDATGCGFIYDSTSGAGPVVCGMGVTGVGGGSPMSRGFMWWDSMPNALIFENNISATAAAGVSGTNPSIFMSRRNTQTQYCSVIGNTFNGMNAHQFFLAYDTDKTVCENNNCINSSGDSGGHGFFFKENNRRASVRNNRGLTGNSAKLFHITPTGTYSNDIECCWNNYKSSVHGIWLGPAVDIPITNFWEYRNTWQVPYNEWAIAYGLTATGNWVSEKNVIQHNGSHTNGIYVNTSEGGGANLAGTITQSNLTATSGLVDASGNLTSGYSSSLGLYGMEVA